MKQVKLLSNLVSLQSWNQRCFVHLQVHFLWPILISLQHISQLLPALVWWAPPCHWWPGVGGEGGGCGVEGPSCSPGSHPLKSPGHQPPAWNSEGGCLGFKKGGCPRCLGARQLSKVPRKEAALFTFCSFVQSQKACICMLRRCTVKGRWEGRGQASWTASLQTSLLDQISEPTPPTLSQPPGLMLPLS